MTPWEWVILVSLAVMGVCVPLVARASPRRMREKTREVFRGLEKDRQEFLNTMATQVRDDLDRYLTTPRGAEEAEAWASKKMTPYEAGEDGPLCQRCLQRWCPGDCPQAGGA